MPGIGAPLGSFSSPWPSTAPGLPASLPGLADKTPCRRDRLFEAKREERPLPPDSQFPSRCFAALDGLRRAHHAPLDASRTTGFCRPSSRFLQILYSAACHQHNPLQTKRLCTIKTARPVECIQVSAAAASTEIVPCTTFCRIPRGRHLAPIRGSARNGSRQQPSSLPTPPKPGRGRSTGSSRGRRVAPDSSGW